MEYIFRKATAVENGSIMEIINDAKQQMLREGKSQWNESYPTISNIDTDIANGNAYVMLSNGRIVAYGAVVFTGEPAYDNIEGQWSSEQPYVVLHRIAVARSARRKGIGMRFMHEVERLSISKGIHSFKVDTNYDNERMLRLFEKMGFVYCGKICYPQGERMGYEKLL